MTLPPEFYRKRYDADNYDCSRFAVDVISYYFGKDIAHDMACFLVPKMNRYADISIKNKFRIVPHTQSRLGDLVVLHTHDRHSHVAVKLHDGEYIQIAKEGVLVLSWELLNIGFKRAKVYRHVSNSIRL